MQFVIEQFLWAILYKTSPDDKQIERLMGEIGSQRRLEGAL